MPTKRATTPDVIDHFQGYIGQESLIASIRQYLRLPVFPNVFFVSMPGCGKSDLSRRIATAIGKPSHEIGCRKGMNLDSILLQSILRMPNGGVLFFDELPLMPSSAQSSIRTLTEDGRFFDKDGNAFEFPNLTVLAAGTDPTKIDGDLIDRFDTMEFDPYSIDDLCAIGEGFNTRYVTSLEYSTIERLAIAAQGSPRKLRKLFENAVSALIASDEKPTPEAIFTTARICPDGTSPLERTVLRTIGNLLKDGSKASLSRLATALKMRERAILPILENLESYGYVSTGYGSTGRKLTNEGINKLREIGLD